MAGIVPGAYLGSERGWEEEPNYNLLALPVVILVYIFSLLPLTCDKARLRYVSRRTRLVSETPSLWTEFVWPHYTTREERCVNGILKACGGYVKQLSFPDYAPAPSKLVRMAKYCRNVVHLSIGTCLSDQQLNKIVENMVHLQKLEVHWMPYKISSLLLIAAKLQLVELTMYRQLLAGYHGSDYEVSALIEEFVNLHCTLPNLNVVTKVCPDLIESLVFGWKRWNNMIPPGWTANVKLYNSLKVPHNVSFAVPDIQLQFGQLAILPLVKASDFGLFGIDLLLLTNCTHNGKRLHKAFVTRKYFGYDSGNNVIGDHVNTSVINLSFITHFDASDFKSLFPGHLEQISVACPHLKQLNLEGNNDCLRSLVGLRSVAKCSALEGLNLLGIHVEDIEDDLELWKILSQLNLTHLALELCIMHPCEEKKPSFICLLQKCFKLCIIECGFGNCDASLDIRYLLVCHFPSLVHCVLHGFQSNYAEKVLSSCDTITHFKYVFRYMFPYVDSPAHNHNIQQLCIEVERSKVGDIFMDTVSAHGKLKHVVMYVSSVTLNGIRAVIQNSLKLMTFHIYVYEDIHDEQGVSVTPTAIKSTLKKAFPNRQLFAVGSLKILDGDEYCQCLYNYDVVLPLWRRDDNRIGM